MAPARISATIVLDKTPPQDLADVEDTGPVQYLIDDFIPKDYPTSLYGDGGQGKSYIAMHIAHSIITQKPFLGKAILAGGNVMYLDWELDSNTQAHRWREVSRGYGLEEAPRGLVHKRMILPLQVCINDIYQWLDIWRPSLVIVDSVGRAMGGDPLNPATSIEFMRHVETLGTTLLIDHQARATADKPYASMREFGTSYKGHYVRCSWQIERVGQEEMPGIIGLIFRHKKTNFGPLLNEMAATLTFRKQEDGQQVVSLTSATALQEMSSNRFGIKGGILQALKLENMTTEQIAETLSEFDNGSVRNEVSQLRRVGLLVQVAKDGKKPVYGLAHQIDPRMRLVAVGTA